MSHRRIFCALALLAAPSHALAQSFNCNNAATPVEKLICGNEELKTLDSALDEKVQKALNASAAEREKLLAEERQWVKERDRKCPARKGADADQIARSAACLTESYRARITAINAIINAQQVARGPDKALCQRVADAYRSIVAGDPKALFDKDGDKPAMAASPLTVLEKAPHPIFTRAQPVGEVTEATTAKVERWAKTQKPPIRIPEKLMNAIFEDEPSMLTIDRAPDTNFYAASTVQGTAHCLIATYFEVKDGVAQRAGEPPLATNDSCGVDQFFGSLDGRPVAVVSSDNRYGPSLSVDLTFAPWDKDFFRAPCSVAFEFEPAFNEDAGGDASAPEEKCESAQCKALQGQARALVEEAQRHPLKARKAAIARIAEGQRATFEKMENLAPKDKNAEPQTPELAADPASYREDGPLLAPLVHDGEVYLASVGHTTIGWRTFAGWSVKLERLEKDQLKSVGTVYVDMTPGRLRRVTVR